MPDEENVSVEEQSEAVAEATETETTQQEREESAAERKKRNDQEYNWAEARRKMQELDRQNEEMRKQLSQMQQPPKANEDDELDKIADDDIVTKAQVKKLASKMAMQIAQEAIKQREASTVDERLQLKFSDFADVVTKENIELLRQQEPELAMSLYHNPDPFAQGVAAYKLLKKVGIGGESVTNKLDRERALKNSQKPISVNAVAKSSALGEAHKFENGLTKELKNQLWAEMKQAMKGA
jgi:hypothetical protein